MSIENLGRPESARNSAESMSLMDRLDRFYMVSSYLVSNLFQRLPTREEIILRHQIKNSSPPYGPEFFYVEGDPQAATEWLERRLDIQKPN